MKKIFTLIALFFPIFALQAQTIHFNPEYLEATVAPHSTVTVETLLSNTGDDTLAFHFPGYAARGMGGPDDFGYCWIDSNEEGGPPWEYNDISETGTLVEGLGDDNTVGPFEMGFDFSYYGEPQCHFWISGNGCVVFHDAMIPYANTPIPTGSEPAGFIAWFWDDLKPVEGVSKVYIKHFDTYVIVQFDKFTQYLRPENYIYGQIVLKAGGDILLKYRHITGDFNAAAGTVGIQSFDPDVGLQVVCDTTYLHPEMIVRFDAPQTFITSVTPAAGHLPPGHQETIHITYSSVGFEVGDYTADLKCVSNDPEHPATFTHHTMHVQAPEQAGFEGFVTDAATDLPINDVKVRAGEQYVFTNGDGYYELPLEHGTYTVKFTREGYEPVIVEDTVAVPGFSTLDVSMSGYYSIAGRVRAGDNWLETGFAYGYKMVEGVVVDVYAEMVEGEGNYQFSGLTAAQYIIKAEPSPNSAYYGLYLPTYYVNVLHWEDATVINLTQNTDGIIIHLVPVSTSQGPGTISGMIEDGSFGPAPVYVPVVLESTACDFVTMTYTGPDGSFSFSNLAFDTYKLFAEIPGKSTVPMAITLDEENTSISGITMVIMEGSIIFMGIGDQELSAAFSQVYPNPASTTIAFDFALKSTSLFTVDIMDFTGKTISHNELSSALTGRIVLDIHAIPAGMYLIKVTTNIGTVLRKFTKN
jgi:hypothetical protein